jgi:transposase
MPRTRRPYPPEFRREAVQLVRSGRSVKDVADSLGRRDQSLHIWVKQDQLDRKERDDGLTSAERDELPELRRRGKRLEQERQILKRAAVFLERRPRPGGHRRVRRTVRLGPSPLRPLSRPEGRVRKRSGFAPARHSPGSEATVTTLPRGRQP